MSFCTAHRPVVFTRNRQAKNIYYGKIPESRGPGVLPGKTEPWQIFVDWAMI